MPTNRFYNLIFLREKRATTNYTSISINNKAYSIAISIIAGYKARYMDWKAHPTKCFNHRTNWVSRDLTHRCRILKVQEHIKTWCHNNQYINRWYRLVSSNSWKTRPIEPTSSHSSWTRQSQLVDINWPSVTQRRISRILGSSTTTPACPPSQRIKKRTYTITPSSMSHRQSWSTTRAGQQLIHHIGNRTTKSRC